MKTSKFKKGLSLLLSILMIFTMLPSTVFTFAAEENYPVMKSFNAASGDDFHRYYKQVYTVTFLNEIDIVAMDNALEKWDISAVANSGDVMAWMYLNQEATDSAGENRYDVYVAGDGGVEAHADTTHMFYVFSSLKEVKGMENFHTGKVKSFLFWFGNCYELESIDLSKMDTSSATTLKHMFYGCYLLKEADLSSWDVSNVTTLERMFYRCYALEYADLSGWDTSNVTNMYGIFEMTPPNENTNPDYSLEKIDLTGWDTSNVTTMENMFKNCEVLTELDLSSFNTSKVTTMRFMFYYCKSLKNIYVGDGWTTEAIKNINDGVFNCCYALIGGKETLEENIEIYNDKHPNAYYLPNVEYAKTKEEGGYLTDASQKPEPEPVKYTVTYSFVGDVIPEGVSVTPPADYSEGTTVRVADTPSADNYVFSGWSTEDAAVADGEFTISNDVHFTGSWEKLYKVEYRYTEGFPVPEGAPELPDAVYYKAGDLIDVNGVPYVYGYIFVGWTTEDADATGDMFIMPENDVVLYGYFKKPVESVEFIGEDITINKDGETKLNVYVKPEDATIKDIVYESSDESVVTVDKYGNIKAVGEGTAKVTVSSKDDPTKSDTITVTVKIPVTDMTVDKTEINLNKDETDKITATVTPDYATNKEITYESSDENVVKVDENGNIIAVGEGKATITIIPTDNPSLKKEIPVTIKVPVTEITATEDFNILIGEEKNVEAKTNEDATNKGLIYESSDSSIIKVDNDGNVIGVGEGEATITITSKDNPDIKKEVTVTVIRKYKVTYEFIGETIPENVTAPEAKEYNSGSEVAVEAEASAEDYVFSGWSTEDATVADGRFTISNDVHFVGSWTKVKYYDVTYKYDGEVPEGAPSVPAEKTYKEGSEVTVEASPEFEGYTFSGWSTKDTIVTDGEFTINNNVEFVGKWEKIIVPVDEIIVDKTEINLEEGDTDKITVTVTPDDATNKEITYESSDENIVKVDENGNIEAVGEGEATITITSKDDPAKSTTVIVKVTKPEAPEEPDEPEIPEDVPVDEIIVDKIEFSLEEGDTDKITVTVTPDNATNKEIAYESSDENIVKVDENGNIEAVGEGEATITITSKDDPTKSTTIIVKVTKPEAPEEPDEPEIPEEPDEPEYIIEVPDGINVFEGESKNLGVKVTPSEGYPTPTYTSADESIVTVDAEGNIKGIKAGATTITVDFGNGEIRVIPVVVLAPLPIPRKHYICFGKTDGIGWYEVSVNGGDFFPQGPNSTLEVYEGSILVVRVQDMWIDDEFDFYVNGKKVPMDPANTITVVVDGYMLIGALSMDVEVPDIEESLSLLDRIIKAIKDFFAWIKSWFE